MKNIKEESKLLASLVVFRELYDVQNDVYGVIAEFLKEIIAVNGKYQFNLTEITNLLNNTYDFSIPEAVINTALRRLDLKKEDGFFIIQNMPALNKKRLAELQEKNLTSNVTLIESLFSFIATEKATTLSDSEKTKIVRSFCSFLLDDSNATDYSEYISGFAIKNKNDDNFIKSLNKIREGVILYSGIKYSNLGEIGSWQTNLTIYLDTEILFHFAGFNGELYKSLFEDFFRYVKEINDKAKKVIVRLEYFKEVKDEIENFFTKAEYIVEGKDRLNPRNTAMASVVDGCKSPSDVLSKKSDFYVFIKNNGIYESKPNNYYAQANYKYNIIDSQTIESVSGELQFDITEYLDFLNYVNIQRQKENLNSFENIGYILLTGNTRTIKIARHKKIKADDVVPLATTLNWITNKFWFKLNKGFGDGNFPASFDVIVKAQMVLSSVLNKSIGEKFDELQTKFKQGEITEEIAKSRVVKLRSQVRKPEEIGLDDISQILDVLSEDSLEQFIKEQELSKNEAKKQSKENTRLKKELIFKEEALAKEETTRIETQSELILTYEKNLSDKKEMIERLENNKNPIDKLAHKDFNNFKMKIGLVAIFLFSTSHFLAWKFGLDIMSTISWLSPLLIFLYLLIFDKEWNWNPKVFLEKKKEQYQQMKYLEFHFDIKHLNRLKEEIHPLQEEIENLKNKYRLT
ncbi:MAG: hypothetical protein Q8L64_00435 [bacterium]|jgi:hypothetical protein|nr:hypothetical protein [bacterium]